MRGILQIPGQEGVKKFDFCNIVYGYEALRSFDEEQLAKLKFFWARKKEIPAHSYSKLHFSVFFWIFFFFAKVGRTKGILRANNLSPQSCSKPFSCGFEQLSGNKIQFKPKLFPFHLFFVFCLQESTKFLKMSRKTIFRVIRGSLDEF